MATDNKEPVFEDLEAYFRVAKYPIVKYTDMNAEMREEASDILITAVEKFPADLEKCTQVSPRLQTEAHVRACPGLPPAYQFDCWHMQRVYAITLRAIMSPTCLISH